MSHLEQKSKTGFNGYQSAKAFTGQGLSETEVVAQRARYGSNTVSRPKNVLLENMMAAASEPMFILLLAACSIYFILGENNEAFTMLAAIMFVAGIDVYQNYRSRKAVKALSRITGSVAVVLRGGRRQEIAMADVVQGDLITCAEGSIIPADAEILDSADFAVNEAILTGESAAVEKFEGDPVFQGTQVVRGYCYALVKAIGADTGLAGIGKLVEETGREKTPMQQKVSHFVRKMVLAGSLAFALVWFYYWYQTGSILQGLLRGLTMAMSVLPEEIPVALSTFMALGAYRLLKHGIIARSPRAVETLGSATVICLDKTGTLTQNLMHATHIYDWSSRSEVSLSQPGLETPVLEYAMWASETEPFDPMEKSVHQMYERHAARDERQNYRMVKEYPLAGTPPVMTHIYQNEAGATITACKGGLEGILKLCDVPAEEQKTITERGSQYAAAGQRVLGVARGQWSDDHFPATQEEIPFTFLGMITFYDPPVENIDQVIRSFYDAGVDVKMITGDYPATAKAVAALTGMAPSPVLTGREVESMSDQQLRAVVKQTGIFARIAPAQKLRIVEALKQEGEIVSMTGDGVNDAPALKAAHIGITMGKRGTEVAKASAGMVLAKDDLAAMTDAIYLGRRIHTNLTKAIRYIISIHIPIILLVLLPIFFHWLPGMLFTPVHVIFLELIMGPTCSIIYENEPVPQDELDRPGGSQSSALFSFSQLRVSILQGLMITAGCLVAGYYAASVYGHEDTVRTFVFSTILLSNVLLTLANRSFRRSILETIGRKNPLIPVITALSLIMLLLILHIPFLNTLFDVHALHLSQLLIPAGLALMATLWLEPFKIFRQHRVKTAI